MIPPPLDDPRYDVPGTPVPRRRRRKDTFETQDSECPIHGLTTYCVRVYHRADGQATRKLLGCGRCLDNARRIKRTARLTPSVVAAMIETATRPLIERLRAASGVVGILDRRLRAIEAAMPRAQ